MYKILLTTKFTISSNLDVSNISKVSNIEITKKISKILTFVSKSKGKN